MATTVELGNIQARITATTGRFESAVRRVNTRLGTVKATSKSLQDRIKSLNRAFDGLYKSAEKVAKTGQNMQKWFGGTLAAQTAAVTLALRQATAYASEAKAVAGQTGLAVESIQALNYAVQQSDGDIKLLTTGLRALARRSAEAAQGNRTFAKYFERLGVRVQNADGSMRALEDILMDVADAVQALGSETEASAALMGLMGDAGRQLVPFMRQGSAGIRDLMREARSLGLVLDRETVQRLSAFGDQTNRIQLALGALTREWGISFLPIAERIAARLENVVRAFHRLDQEQKNLVFRFSALSTAVMAGGFAFSTLLVILPQLVRGLQIVMGVMGAFASPWVLGIAAVVAAAFLLKRAWDENLGGIQERTESVVSTLRNTWRGFVDWLLGKEVTIMPGFDPRRVRVGGILQEISRRLPGLDWDRMIDDAADSAKQAWDRARETLRSLETIQLPTVEWPGWPTIDATPVVAKWDEAKREIENLPPIELPSIEIPNYALQVNNALVEAQAVWNLLGTGFEPIKLPEFDTGPFFASWNRFVDGIGTLQAPEVPPEVESWFDRFAERFQRTPAGQVALNIGRLANEVMAGDKTLGEALTELFTSNLSIPLTAMLWTLTPLSTGWKLTLAAVTLALNFLPNVDLSASGIVEAIDNAAREITELLNREDLITIGDQQYSAADISYNIGQALAEAIIAAIEIGIGLAATLLGVSPELTTPALELGKAIAENIVIPMVQGFTDRLTEELKKLLPQAIQDAWKAASDFVTGRDEATVKILSDPKEAARGFREATQDRQFALRPQLSLSERILGWLRARLGIRPEGTPEFQSGTPWTGWGPLNEVAGVVHRQEAVIPADVLREGPGAVLEFLGAPGFQSGKLGVPLGADGIQAEADRLQALNEQSLGELQQATSVLGAMRTLLDTAGDKIEQIAEETPFVRDLVELVRVLVGLAKAGATEPGPTARLIEPERPVTPTLWDRIRGLLGQGLAWLKEQGAAAGEQLRQFSATVGQALTPVGILTSLLNALSEPVEALLVPITMVVSALSQALLPVFKATFPIIKTFGVLLLTVLQGIATVWNALVGTIGGVFRALYDIKILGIRPFGFLKGVVDFFEGLMIDTKALSQAQKELRDLTWEEAVERTKNIDAIKKTTEALHNVPSGFKVALARFQAATPVQSFATGGYVPPTPGGRIVRVAEGGEGEYIVPESKMGRSVVVKVDLRNSTIYGVDDLDRRITTVVKKALQQERMVAYGVS